MRSPRETAELLLPGFIIGSVAGVVAGGLAAISGLSTAHILVSAFGFGLPLAVLGAGYSAILASGRIRMGGIAPAALYWAIGFPIARLVHESAVDAVFPNQGLSAVGPVLPWLLLMAVLSTGWTIGFMWLHEHLAPYWWLRIRDHNARANSYVEGYMSQAVKLQYQKESRRRPKSKAQPVS